jgi:hypothetical protein
MVHMFAVDPFLPERSFSLIDQISMLSSIIRAPTNDNFERYAQYSWLDAW